MPSESKQATQKNNKEIHNKLLSTAASDGGRAMLKGFQRILPDRTMDTRGILGMWKRICIL